MATITGRLVSPVGTPAANYPFKIQLVKKGNLFVSGQILSLTANGSGEFSLSLSDGVYCIHVGATLEHRLFISVPVSDQTFSFKQLITTAP